MANEVINPWQQFLDDVTGDPLANGTIEFFETAAKLAQKTLIAGDNPTTLDNSGRIRGTVRYEGTATLEITRADGYQLADRNDVVAASAGNTASITKQRESVAAMIADQSLMVGDLVATRGYYFPNRYGGARYVIVPAGTGTPDNYLYIVLGNGLQAELLDRENEKSFLVAGARGDGADDTVAMQAVVNVGGQIQVEDGFTFSAFNLLIPLNCTFVGGGAMVQRSGADGDFLQITSKDVTRVLFRGVTLDGNQPNTNSDNATVGWVIEAA